MIWFVGFAVPLTLLASPADDFKAANQLFDAGKFTDAAAAYEKIQPKTAAVYFNLGNACFRDGQIGRAILNYQRARRLAPRDPDILANLKFAEQRLGVEDANTPPQGWKSMLQSVVYSRTPAQWSIAEILGLWLAAIAIGLGIWTPRVRTPLLVTAVAAFAWMSASAWALSYQVVGERTAPQAVVLATKTEARFAPLPDSTVHFPLTEGTAVAVREDRGGWWFVERADGRQGWIKSDTAERVGVQ